MFKKSGVKNAHAHRYRHTLATRLLAEAPLSNKWRTSWGTRPAVVRKHYGKWSKGRQDNIDRLMLAHFRPRPLQFQSHRSHTKILEAVN